MTAPRLTQRTATIHLYQGDDQDALEELQAEVQHLAQRYELEKEQPQILSGTTTPDDLDAAAKRYDALVAEARERAVAVVVKPLGRKRFDPLIDEHPPREGHKIDEQFGYNRSTFPEALVADSLVAPEFDSDEDRADFLDGLTSAQFEQIFTTAFGLNRRLAADPKALNLSIATQSDDEITN